jgi:hypothetical protein
MPTRKSKVIIPIAPMDILGPVGYHSYDPVEKRRKCLRAAMKKWPYIKIIQRMNATAIRLKNTQPHLSKNLKSDMKYMKEKYRGKSKSRRSKK